MTSVNPPSDVEDTYRLGRNLAATTRLNLQHYMFSRNLGYDLHPSIPISAQNFSIAEIGTGTGYVVIWLTELSHQLSSTCSLHGYDVSDEQFPHLSFLPTNVSLQVLDATKPCPGHLRGKYDVVHLRLFLAVVANDDPSSLLAHAIDLLKPGGHLQWSEFDNHVQKPIASAPPSKAVERVCQIVNTGSKLWVARLPQSFEEHGLTCTAVERQREQPWQRQILMDNTCLVVEEFANNKFTQGAMSKEICEELLWASRQAQADSKRGSYFSQIFQVVVGQKAA